MSFLDIMSHKSGFFLKTFKTNEAKIQFPYEWFNCTEKLHNGEFPPYDSFFNIMRNNKPLEKDYNHFENLVQSRSSRDQALAKLRMDNVPPTGAESYAYLQNIWDN